MCRLPLAASRPGVAELSLLVVRLEENLDVNLAIDNERGSPAAGARFEVAASAPTTVHEATRRRRTDDSRLARSGRRPCRAMSRHSAGIPLPFRRVSVPRPPERHLVQKMILLVVVNLLMALTPLVAQNSTEQIFLVLPRDAIPAIDTPTFMSTSAADRFFSDDEIVIGIVGETEQRAYSTWQLDRHEIVNDVFEGRPIAVTW